MKKTIEIKKNAQSVPKVSKFGLLASISFILLTLLGRAIFPFGDEPDFSTRAPSLIFTEHPIWVPYFYLDVILQKLNYASSCRPISSPFSITATIDINTCIQGIEQILLRTLMTFVVILPLLYAIIFRRSFVFLLRIVRCKGTAKEWNERLDTLSLSLLFPGMIYYLNVLSIEQFTLLLSLFVFILRSGIGITLLLIAFIFSIDKGNALIVLSLISLNWFVLRYIDGIKLSKYFVSVISVAIGVYFINFLIIEYLSAIAFLQQKITAILHKYSGVDVVKKYPVILRPAITYMSFIALTPAYLKSVLAYIVTAVSILLTILKIMKLYLWHKKNKLDLNSLKRRVVMAFNAIIVILGFIFILPDYANGKYYIFMMPFILLLFFTIYSKKHIYLFMLVLNSIVFANYYSFIT